MAFSSKKKLVKYGKFKSLDEILIEKKSSKKKSKITIKILKNKNLYRNLRSFSSIIATKINKKNKNRKTKNSL
jgi:hypothetical protein